MTDTAYINDGEYVRNYYKVPARTGGRIVFDGQPGTIEDFEAQYIWIRLDKPDKVICVHPTWRMEYL